MCTKPSEVTFVRSKSVRDTAVILSWNSVKLAAVYFVEVFREGNWSIAANTTKPFAVVKNLTPNTEYRFRVFALNQCGRGADSGEIVRRTLSSATKSIHNVVLSNRSEPGTVHCPSNLDKYVYSDVRSLDVSSPLIMGVAFAKPSLVGGTCLITKVHEEVTTVISDDAITIEVPKVHFVIPGQISNGKKKTFVCGNLRYELENSAAGFADAGFITIGTTDLLDKQTLMARGFVNENGVANLRFSLVLDKYSWLYLNSLASVEARPTVRETESIPTNLTVEHIEFGNKLSWTPVNCLLFIERTTSGVTEIIGGIQSMQRTFVDKCVIAGKTYCYKLKTISGQFSERACIVAKE